MSLKKGNRSWLRIEKIVLKSGIITTYNFLVDILRCKHIIITFEIYVDASKDCRYIFRSILSNCNNSNLD